MGDEEKWRELARDLGFEFKEGLRGFLESPALQMMAIEGLTRDGLDQAGKFLEKPWVQALLTRMFLGVVTGRHQGIEFHLYRGGKTSGSRTVYDINVAALFGRSLHCGLVVYRSGFLARLGRRLFPNRYVRIPHDPEFDRLVVVRARDEVQALAYFSSREVRGALLDLFRSKDDYKINDHGLRYKAPGRTLDRARALELMDRMAEVVEKIT
ncbi:MAG: hypothetical protein AB1896_15175 [Thermodesulfobacteriota bacterium]